MGNPFHLWIFLSFGSFGERKQKNGVRKKVEGKKKPPQKKREEETFVSIFFLAFDHVFTFGIFMFGVCMIEAISCTQTEFFVGRDSRLENYKI